MELLSIQNSIIIVLLIVLIFSFLGINILVILAEMFQNILNVLLVLLVKSLSTLGYTTGTVVNSTSDVVTNVGKTSLDVLNGTIHSVDNVLIGASNNNATVPSWNLPTFSPLSLSKQTQYHPPDLNASINTQSTRSNQVSEPMPTPSTMPIQNPISSSKINYCLVGEFQSKRGCVEVGDNDLCMSGQLFASKDLCMNPTQTPNMQPSPQLTPFNSIAMFPLPPIPPNQPNELRPQGIYNA
jgi:hypothetical protein